MIEEHPSQSEIPIKAAQPTHIHKKLSKTWLILFLILVILVISIVVGFIYRSRQSINSTVQKNASYVITKNDFGKILQTRPGNSIILHLNNLDKNLTETLSIDNTDSLLVQKTLTYNPQTNTFDAVVQTKAPGIAKLSVLGRPKCREHAMCPQYIILEFTMNIKTQ